MHRSARWVWVLGTSLLASCASPESGGTGSVASRPSPAAERPSEKTTTPSAAPPLLDRIGGETVLLRVVDGTLAHAQVDPRLKARMTGANLPRFRDGFAHVLGQAAGGAPASRGGTPFVASHRGMGISDAEYDAFRSLFEAELAAAKLGARERRELTDLLEGMRGAVVERAPGVDVRLARIEARLEAMDARLVALGRERAATSEPPMKQLAPAALPKPSDVDPAFKGPKWTPMEKALTATLASRLGRGTSMDRSRPPSPLVGRPLPLTRFLSGAGDVVDLARLDPPRTTVLVILRGFSGSICLHCSAQALALAEAADAFRRLGAEVVLVYPGAAESVPAFIAATQKLDDGFKPRYPILLDVDLALVHLLGIEGALAKPTSLVIDKEGIVRFAYIGRQPADRPSASDLLGVVSGLARTGGR